MSGICGLVDFDGAPPDPEVLHGLVASASYRGPDGVREWLEGPAAFAHLAFHVTPESRRERQPLVSADGRQALVADARLDNRDELIAALRPELPPQPTDADLILAAYRRWGTHCPERLLGDFVFAIWEPAEQRLTLVRDALGGRSLCYWRNGARFVFASEVGQILDLAGFPLRLNDAKIARYLLHLGEEQEETFFQSVYYCPPAHVLTISRQGIAKRRYWEVDPGARIRYADDRDYAAHFLDLVTAAVRCRLRSTGQVGISLSGGQDSTLLAAVAARLLPAAGLPQSRLKSFSYVFDELASCDEREYIRPVVERCGLEATYLPADDKWTFKDPAHWPVERDYLWSDAYVLLPLTVAQAARDAGCRVLLNGQFGDALFVGGAYWAADLLRDGRLGDLTRALMAHRREIDWRRDLLRHGLAELLPPTLWRAYRRWRPGRAAWMQSGLHPDLMARTGLAQRWAREERDRRYSAPGQWRRLRALIDSSWSNGAGEVRKLYNRLGLEVESPYYDRRILELVMAVPADQLGRPWRNRWVQRNAMRGLLPEAVCERRTKTGFEPLMERGLRERELAGIRRLFEDARCVHGGYVDPGWLRRVLSGPAPPVDDLYGLWLFASLELWLRRIEKPKPTGALGPLKPDS